MQIPKIAQDKIPNEIYSAIERDRKNNRKYMGMSEIGHPCDRKLWLSFRNVAPIPIEGRVLMIFAFGDMIENILVKYIKHAGYKITGLQDTFSAHDGLFLGHCDGIIHGVTQQPHILEIKSCNDSKFKMFKAKGVKATNPQYYCQTQCYMGYAGLDRSLHVIQNKNTSEIYTERGYFSKSDFQTLHDRAYQIITSNQIPEPGLDDSSMQCNWCDFRVACRQEDMIMADNKICGNCKFFEFHGLKKWCNKHDVEIKTWGISCPDWVDMFKKGFIK